jgi:general secretion pathway protein D
MATNVSMSPGVGGGEAVADVRVVADDENNALMIYATAMQYRVIEAALEQLDVVATQVIIEASIMEVSLTDELNYGLEWVFKNGLGNDYSGEGILSSIADATEPTSILPGFSYTVTNSVGDVSAVLNALAKESLLNIISTPSVMVLDNHEAYIHVGNQVPVIDSQTESLAGSGDRVTQSISYRDTGVKLTVRPSVNAGGLVTMDVIQSVTDVGEIDVATGQRAFLERNIQSRVAVRSNESVVLGGLIRENASNASQGVPFLHNIPVVGSLFGTDRETGNRTELLVIITPRALYNESELREVSREMRSRVRNLELVDPKDLR